MFRCGRLAQLGERCVRNAEVEGSIPFFSTITRRPTVLRWPFCLLAAAYTRQPVRKAEDCVVSDSGRNVVRFIEGLVSDIALHIDPLVGRPRLFVERQDEWTVDE